MGMQQEGREHWTQSFDSLVVPLKGMKEMKKPMFQTLLIFLVFLLTGISPFSSVLAAEVGAPVISGSPLVLSLGESYDPLEGISITDDLDLEEDLLAKLEFREFVDPESPGEYEIHYFVTDSSNKTGWFIRPVAVLGPELPVIVGGTYEVEKDADYDPMKNVYAFDEKDGDLSASIHVLRNDVDSSMPGEYTVVFEVTDSDLNRAEKTITVYVFWPQEYYPILQTADRMIQVGDEYDPLFGATATDLTDGDLTAHIEVQYTSVDPSKPGVYYTEYMVVNSLGLMANSSSRVVVFDLSTSPAIMVEPVYLETGWTFDPLAGVYAYDLEDGDITPNIVIVENTVDKDRAGAYVVKYRVEDSQGNAAEATATVVVEWSWEWMPQIEVDPTIVYLPLNGIFDPMAGVTATDRTDGDITHLVEVNSFVDTSIAGAYYVDYSATNSLGITNGAWRQVIVFESSVPVVWAENFNSPLDQELDPMWMKFEAYDLEDGDLRESIVWDVSAVDIHKAGTYPIVVSVTDSDGNTAQTTCTVTIIDYSYPELYVEDYQAYLNAEFDPLNYVSAWDPLDGDITDQVVVTENNVKIKKEGVYTVTYSVTNSLGKTTSKTVNVEVTKEPVIDYYIIYGENLFRMESDASGTMAFITPETGIPEGAELGIAMYADGESVIEFYGYTMGNELLPGFTYSLEVGDGQIITGSILPYLYNGQITRTTAMDAQIQVQSTVDGALYYAVAEKDAGIPEIDTTGNGIAASVGANTFKMGDLKPGVKPQVVYIVLKGTDGELTNILAIDVPKVPTPPNQGKKPEDPGKPEEPIPEASNQELDGVEPATEELEKIEPALEGSLEEAQAVEVPVLEDPKKVLNLKPVDQPDEEIAEETPVVEKMIEPPILEDKEKKDNDRKEPDAVPVENINNRKSDQK